MSSELEDIQAVKDVRPDCEYHEDGHHVWIEYNSTGTKECHDCGYVEAVIVPR